VRAHGPARAVALLAALAAAACGGPEPATPAAKAAPAPTAIAPPRPVAGAPGSEADVRRMLELVSSARGLPIKGPVTSKLLNRAEIVPKLRKHIGEEVPLDVVVAQAETLIALGIVPPDYDVLEGLFAILGGRIAGFYEPSDKTMYLIDDLQEEEARETLAHELVHALQDQTYSLAEFVKYKPGQSDKSAAVHALIEGDAMSAMFDVMAGEPVEVPEDRLRALMMAAPSASGSSAATPRYLQASLVAAYADGLAFVQGRRRKGGWPAVDAAYRRLPDTTEQLLHQDKYDAREMALAVAPISIDALGAGFKAAIDEDIGEQDLRLVLEEWTGLDQAKRAAAGWGGDRYVLARKEESGRSTFAIALRVKFDTTQDAKEMADVLSARFARCAERKDLGPFAWRLTGRDVAITGGPYTREGKTTRSAGTCALANRWIDAILKSP
jgi:hypothetical protein